MTVKKHESVSEPVEKDSLIKEKIELAKKIGIWETFKPVENYESTEEYKRIKEIDERLALMG